MNEDRRLSLLSKKIQAKAKKVRIENTFKHVLMAKILQFCKHCSLHGVYYLYSCANRWVFMFWSLTMVFSIGLCAFLSHMIWEKFIIDPTFTVVETTHYATEEIPFPAVSVCDTDEVYGSNTNITEILRLRGFESRDIDDFYDSMTDVKHRGYVAKSHVRKIHNVLENLGYTYNILLQMFKRPCEKLIEECIWRAEFVNCSQMFRPVSTYIGYCCQFDLSYFRVHAEKNTNFAAGTEVTEALEITLNTGKLAGDDLASDGYILLYVFDKEYNITLLDSAITVTSATYFDVTINVWLMESSVDVKALSLANRKCFLKNDLSTEASSYQNCMMNLVVKKVVEHCGCLPFNFKHKELNVEDFPSCSWSRLICVYETLEKVQENKRDIISYNKCFQNCDYVQYDTQVDYLKQDRGDRNSTVNSRITIHYKDNSCMKYRREVLYTWDQMLANLGGIFGLCLGGSIISIIEIFWFILDLMYACFANLRFKLGKVRSVQADNRIFVISKNDNITKKNGKAKVMEVSGRFKFIH